MFAVVVVVMAAGLTMVAEVESALVRRGSGGISFEGGVRKRTDRLVDWDGFEKEERKDKAEGDMG